VVVHDPDICGLADFKANHEEVLEQFQFKCTHSSKAELISGQIGVDFRTVILMLFGVISGREKSTLI
jgi:hypothetical protein